MPWADFPLGAHFFSAVFLEDRHPAGASLGRPFRVSGKVKTTIGYELHQKRCRHHAND